MSDSKLSKDVQVASRQQQFLNVISRDEATEKFQAALNLGPLGIEAVSLNDAHGRILAEDLIAAIDVPGFDRSNVDGFALIADDTTGAMEESPRQLQLNDESLLPGRIPQITVQPGTATPISTGGVLPRGADAVIMIEETDFVELNGHSRLEVSKSVPPGNMITYAGTDIANGETVLWAHTRITSREIGIFASLGLTKVNVFKQPQVAIISTGDEVVAPGDELPVGAVYDSNAAILSAAVEECGGQAILVGRVRDNLDELNSLIQEALKHDVVLLSGGTSKGAGDLSYQVVQKFNDPGIVAHGVALKPGKPICLAVTQGKPVVILPGFPTSAIFTFYEFVAPVIREFAAQDSQRRKTISAKLPIRINSGRGRTEYSLVRLFPTSDETFAFPIGKGSGSVTTFSHADGFITIPQHLEIVDAGTVINVTLLDEEIRTAELVVIGSHCIGLDYLLSQLNSTGIKSSVMHVGSEAGLAALKRGECHLAGVHLFDEKTNTYNRPFLNDDLEMIPGYRRMQCFVCRVDDDRFANKDAQTALQVAVSEPACSMVNRNHGSGTRILTDQLLKEFDMPQRPNGYSKQVKSHNAVAAAIRQGRADWGIAIESVARHYGLRTIPVQEEHYDFVTRKEFSKSPAIQEFRALLLEDSVNEKLSELGFTRTSS
ncbi:molybdopterin biosynthesis protein [Planctomicrobium sp.]|jgi:putative molybdopterin biosynthesis protein|nr:molybdopterin biosynthesis protein [Planctomicrobium sp.]